MTKLVVLSADPGVVNHGYAVIAIPQPHLKSSFSRLQILQYGRILSTVRDLKSNMRAQADQYCSILSELRKSHSPNAYIAERYQSRRMGGTTIECVNVMLGLSVREFHGLPIKLLPASQWKNAAARSEFWFDELYQNLKPHGVTPHAVDAVCIALYGVGLLTKSSPYQSVNLVNLQRKLRKAKHIDLGVEPVKAPRRKRKVKRGR